MLKSRVASKCAIIIPNWNGREFISESIDSLLKQKHPIDIIVVENGSSDGSAEHIKKNHPGVILLEYPDNAGFAGGVNRGIRFALENNYKYIGLFNNDAVADIHWAESLIGVLDKKKNIAIATGILYRKDGKHIDSTGDFITRSGMPFPRDRNVASKDVSRKPGPVFGATGGASVYRDDLFKKIGLFDEKFFAYYEDVDISFRAQLSGMGVYFISDAKAYHAVSATSSKLGDFSRYHSVKNFVMLYVKKYARIYVC
jgi:GT2 family glycosyltransferase